MTLWSVALAVLIERFTGYPKMLQRLAGHPVQWIGAMINWLDNTLNIARENQLQGRLRGIAALALLLAASVLPAWLISSVFAQLPGGWILDALVATAFIAQKSLQDHVRDVQRALSLSEAAGRAAVAKIVGRSTAALDESGISRAALESLAENTADGIVAPVFCYAAFGLPGLVAYKAVNTADSMIGHKSNEYLHFGFAAARLDDFLNLIPARLTALLFAAAALFDSKQAAASALSSAWQDAGKHRSPNAGWPEAAMAGALSLRFGGPRDYEGEVVDLPWMGQGREQLSRDDIGRGLVLYGRSLSIVLAVLTALAVIISV